MLQTVQPIVAKSQAFSDILVLARKVANSNCAVLITGESGTGKELIARTIHDASSSRNGRYVPVNVAAVPTDLIESHLFGHQRGAFTGANENRTGAFRAAANGTLLLDEIGDLPRETQPKLLRALEQNEIVPLGADTPVSVDSRVIAATSTDLQKAVDEGRFRADLLFRINVVQIHIPPLRERPEDILVLAEYYCEKFCSESNRPVVHLSDNVRQCLLKSPWKGNVRELAHVIERAILLTDSDIIEMQHLPAEYGNCGIIETFAFKDAVDTFKRNHIIRALEYTDGNRGDAAELLGLSHATLFRYIDKYDLKGYGKNIRRVTLSQNRDSNRRENSNFDS
jgi:transcriptional regulator with PAS, ATPase and Fis domain